MAPHAVARADTPCVRVQASSELTAPWIDAVHELERQLGQLPASECQPATLVVESAEGSARVVAITPDGRRAERLVTRANSLVATGLGLVMAIPSAAQAPTTTAPPPPPGPPPPATPPSATPAAQPAESSMSAPAALPRLALWLGFDVGGRTAAPATLATADLAVLLDHWLFTVGVRDSPVGFAPGQGFDNDAFREVDVALGVGRRLTAGESSFDLIFAPAITAMRLEWDYSNGVDSAGEDVELSLNVLARAALRLSSHWALTVTLESDLVPGNLTSAPARIQVPAGLPADSSLPPAFPAWTGGLRFGAMGAVL
jgi:hypothetical protein